MKRGMAFVSRQVRCEEGDGVVAKRARCSVCRQLMFYNKHTGQFIRHRDPHGEGNRLCAGSNLTTPVPNTVKAKAKPREQHGNTNRPPPTRTAPAPDPRERCTFCFKLLVPKADGCFRVHTVGSGVRCDGSGRRPSETVIRSAKTRKNASTESGDKDFADLSIRELREIATVAAELEAEQRAETNAIRRIQTEADERHQLETLLRSICDSEDSPEEIQRRLRVEAIKWRRRGVFWRERVAELDERYEADPESWEVELDAAREAMKRCADGCNLIERKIDGLTPQLRRPRLNTRPEGPPRVAPAPSKNAAERLWSAIQRLWT